MIGRIRAHRRASGALAIALSVAACSGGNGDSASRSRPTLPPATTTTRGQSSIVANERFCERSRTTDELMNRARMAGTPQAVEERYNSAAEAVRGMVDVTPDELKKGAETLGRGYGAFVDEMRKAGWSGSRLPAGAMARLGTPDMRAAGERVGAYERKVCGTAG